MAWRAIGGSKIDCSLFGKLDSMTGSRTSTGSVPVGFEVGSAMTP